MKVLTAFIAMMVATQVFSSEISHEMEPGNLHSSGTLQIKIIEERQDDFDAQIYYEIKPRPLVPIPQKYRKGTFIATLPIEYLDERGYEDLAQSGSVTHQGAKLQYVAQADIDVFSQSHHVRLIPESGKWELEAWYHPSVDATGWVKLALELQVPLVGRYKVFSNLID